MNPRTERRTVAGPAGSIEVAVDEPQAAHAGAAAASALPRESSTPALPLGLALVCHPLPTHGGTMDNKVVQTLARAFVQLGWRAVRFNFRGVGASEGAWDHGFGEIDDAMAVARALRLPGLPVLCAGFSFGGYVATHVAARLAEAEPGAVRRVVLVGPAVTNYAPAAVPQDSLVLHGEADEVVPLAAVLDWARPVPLPVLVVPGAGHFFHGQLTLLKQIVLGACRP